MKKVLGSLVVLSLVVSACGPRDAASTSGRGGGSFSTKAVPGVASKEGERLPPPSCGEKAKDFSFMDIDPKYDAQIFSGKVTAYVVAGDYNCYKVGSEVPLQINPKNNPGAPIRGHVKITRAEVVTPESLTEDHAKALNMTLDELQTFVKDLISSNDKAKGVVNITSFKYVDGGTGVTPATTDGTSTTPTTNPDPNAVTLTITLIASTGDRSPTCPSTKKDFDFLKVNKEFDTAIFAGKQKATMSVGDQNCYRVGDLLDIKTAPADASRGQVLISSVQIVPVTKINQTHATAMNMDLADLKTFAQAGIDKIKASSKPFDTKDSVNFTFFEVAKNPADAAADEAAANANESAVPL